MAYVKVWVHTVWGTKNRFPFLTKEIKPRVIEHISANALAKNIHIRDINGHVDHMHALIGLNADRSIADTMRLIKGESAHWVNKAGIIRPRFEWADEYYAASVSESLLSKVGGYIGRQEEHHAKISFADEVKDLMESLKLSQG